MFFFGILHARFKHIVLKRENSPQGWQLATKITPADPCLVIALGSQREHKKIVRRVFYTILLRYFKC